MSSAATSSPRPRHIRQFLDLSTAHLTPSTRNEWALSVPTHVHETTYGFLVWAGDQDDSTTDEGWPNEVVECRRLARSLSCDYLLFDSDADAIGELETFDD